MQAAGKEHAQAKIQRIEDDHNKGGRDHCKFDRGGATDIGPGFGEKDAHFHSNRISVVFVICDELGHENVSHSQPRVDRTAGLGFFQRRYS